MNERRALLVGGGHTHSLALLRFARRPPPARLVLVSDSEFAPYSGMLPGEIAGQFSRAECLIDLPRLCARAGAEFRRATAVSINCKKREVLFADGGGERFDLLSLNVGGAPRPPFSAPGVAAKPATAFMDFAAALPSDSELAIVGAGAGGVEIALALRRRFAAAKISLVGELLPAANDGVRRRLRALIRARDISLLESAAEEFCGGAVSLADGRRAAARAVIFATPVAAPEWLRNGDLILDAEGFVRVNSFLQSESSPAVFAAGDCAASGADKSGVVAVRQAPVLAFNIAAFLSATPLRPWRPRRRFLSILNTADGRAVAGWGGFSASGAWVWKWKKYLDKKFMNLFR
ncbi:MAG: FAD-dependent oxidoreductase [Gammaproteobacteria bacterium]